MPHPTVGGPLTVPHLRDQRGLHPVRPSETGGRWREGTGVLFEPAESLVQFPQRLVGEPPADLARVYQSLTLLPPGQQGPDADTRALGVGIAADHDLLLADA